MPERSEAESLIGRTGTSLLVLLGALAFLGWLALPAAGSPVHAQQASAISLIAIDADTTGNTPTSYPSKLDACAEIEPSASQLVDIVIGPDGIPADMPLKSFQFILLYDASVLSVWSVDSEHLLAANAGSSVFSASDPVPGTSGAHTIAALDASSTAGETGPGVIARVELRAVGTGTTTLGLRLGLQGAALFTSDPAAIPIESVQAAIIAVGASCPAALPQPGPVPAQPAPFPEGDVTPNVTPAGGGGDEAPATAVSTTTGDQGTSSTPSGEESPAAGVQTPRDDSNPSGEASASEDGGDGFPLWAIASIAIGALAVGAAALAAIRRRASR